jgi:hypothetical protein
VRAVGSLSRRPLYDSTYAQLPGLCEKVLPPSNQDGGSVLKTSAIGHGEPSSTSTTKRRAK